MKFRRELALAAALVSLAGCSSSKTTTPTTGPASSTSASGTSSSGPSAASGAGTTVAVTETEFSIDLPSKTLQAGTYTFKVTNSGSFTHNLTVDGPGVEDKASPSLSPGDSGEVTVTLQKGTYTFYCSVDSHKEKGMDATVTVT